MGHFSEILNQSGDLVSEFVHYKVATGLFLLLCATHKRTHHTTTSTLVLLIYLLTIQDKLEGISLWVSASLWGNRMDLSLWPATSSDSTNNKSNDKSNDNCDSSGFSVINLDAITKSKDKLLCDDLESVIHILLSDISCRRRVDIIVDNAGFEVQG